MTFRRAYVLYSLAGIVAIFLVVLASSNRRSTPPESAPTTTKERRVEVILQLRLQAPEQSRKVRVWIPYAVSDENQVIEDVRITGNHFRQGVYREDRFGNAILYAEWNQPQKERSLTYTFRAKRKEVRKKDFPSDELPLDRNQWRQFLLPTSLGPTTGRVKERAEEIVRDRRTVLAKARAIYDWIVDNMYRDPDVKGCGFGDVERMLGKLGGKCGDLHSVFVSLAKSAGIPAREVFGIRILEGKAGDMTKAQHCWAEFFLPGYGWVPVDPSDVQKIMLDNRLDLGQAKPYRDYYFGAVDESRIAYGMGRDLLLNPPQQDGKLNYFMYPYAEADGKALDDLFGFDLGYTISFREL
ncbi:MAG: transglutaminase family protein [Acidobacteria bacterium]|nr:transglutaminase family protein [Acidobacteriota bacterium]